MKDNNKNYDINYLILKKIIKKFFRKMEVIWECEKPLKGPSIFVANHLGALGPVLIMTNFDIRIYPWIISDLVDSKRQIKYLCKNFIEKDLHIISPLSIGVAHFISQIINPIFKTIKVIPVYKNSKRIKETLNVSLEFLLNDAYLLIFPENPLLKAIDGIQPFMTGFIKLGDIYYQKTSKILPFYPLFVSDKASKIIISSPIFYKPEKDYIKQKKK